jgi:carbonic anhydrase
MNIRRSKNLLLLAVVTTLALANPAFAQQTAGGAAPEWGYSGDRGPSNWGETFETCGLGKQQSPIDIESPDKAKLMKITFSYQPSPLNVINNGHTIQVNYAPGSTIELDGKTYELQQFHFHHMSETAIGSKHQPMEAHLVHKDKEGNLLVVAVLLKKGRANSAVNTVWKDLPVEEGSAYSPAASTVEAFKLLPAKHDYYTFSGSLTTPPCSENVTWVVMTDPATVSKEQIDTFAKLYPHNARPVQPLNGRKVMESR